MGQRRERFARGQHAGDEVLRTATGPPRRKYTTPSARAVPRPYHRYVAPDVGHEHTDEQSCQADPEPTQPVEGRPEADERDANQHHGEGRVDEGDPVGHQAGEQAGSTLARARRLTQGRRRRPREAAGDPVPLIGHPGDEGDTEVLEPRDCEDDEPAACRTPWSACGSTTTTTRLTSGGTARQCAGGR